MKPFTILIATFVIAAGSMTASASTSCDCSKLLKQCGANIKAAGSDIQIKTNTRQCAQVTWYADDVAHDTVVVNGKHVQPSKLRSKPFLSVGSCNVCAKVQLSSAKNSSGKGESAECIKRRKNLKLSERFYNEGKITRYELQMSKDLVKKHCK